MPLKSPWSWKHAKRAGPVCVARVLTLMPIVRRQLPLDFVWPEHHLLHVAIARGEEHEKVLGYALSTSSGVMRVEAANEKIEKKLRVEVAGG